MLPWNIAWISMEYDFAHWETKCMSVYCIYTASLYTYTQKLLIIKFDENPSDCF